MGADQFEVTYEGATVDQAFGAAQNEAFYDHGHSGYTGTIAEKPGYKVFDLPAGVTASEVLDALHEFRCEPGTNWVINEPSESLVALLGAALAASLYKVYDDKWGPAVALKVDDSSWLFCGWASS